MATGEKSHSLNSPGRLESLQLGHTHQVVGQRLQSLKEVGEVRQWLDLSDELVELRMFVSTRDVHQGGHCPHCRPLELILFLVLLLHGVGLDLGGAGQLERLHQLVKLLEDSTRAELANPEVRF